MAGQTISLALAAGTATGAGTDFGSGTAITNLEYSLDGGTTWIANSTTPNPTLTGTTLLVRTPVVEDTVQDNGETLTLTATPTGGTAVIGTATINDQGAGSIFNANGSDNTAATKTDDTPAVPPVPNPAPAETPAQTSPPAIVPDAPIAAEVSFSSAFVITTASPLAAVEKAAEPIADIRTSASGFRVVVAEAPEPNLSLFRGITDQFIEANKPATFALPADAFVHTKADATVTITAKLADGRDLPKWVQFDARSGTFQMSPPEGFDEELQIKVMARDSEGREATAIFKLTVGEGKPKSQGRTGLTDQIMAAAKRSSPWLDALRPQGVKAAPDKLPADRLQAAPAAVRQPARVG